MSIISNEIIFRKSVVNDNTSGNGGRMTPNIVTSGVKNNLWPDVPQAERTAGSTIYRKVHIHVANDADLKLVRPRVFIETNTPGDDAVVFFGGTHTDTQATKTETRVYGTGKLNGNVSAGAGSMTVLTEGAALDYIKNGDLIRISDKTSVLDVVGKEEYVTVSSVPGYAGAVATFNFTPVLANAYTSALTRVASIYAPSDVIGIISGTVKTLGGTFNDATYPILVDSIGGIYQTWTLTFSNATTFACVGDTVGSMGTGNTGSDFAPTNTDYSKPYFNLRSAAWGGVMVNGNTLVFTTSPACMPIWEKRIIPAAANSLSGNKVIFGVDGESE